MDMETVLAGTTIGTVIIILAVTFAVIAVFYAAIYALYAFAFYKTAKKFNYDKTYLAFIPFVQTYTCLYMLSDFAGRTDFSITPAIDEKIKIKDRKQAFLIAVLTPLVLGLLGGIISFILGLTMILAPLASLVTMFFSVLGAVVVGAVAFVYIRDFLDMFEADKQKVVTLAVIGAIFSIIIPVYLIIYLKKEPVYVTGNEFQYEDNTESEF